MGLSVPGEQAAYTGNKTITGSLTIGGQILAAASGSPATPDYSFAAQTDLGFRRATTSAFFAVTQGVDRAAFTGGSFELAAATKFSWSSTSGPSGTEDLVLIRDAANVLALRNAANAQEFRIYRTYTDPSNNEYATFGWNGASQVNIGMSHVGTGVARLVDIGSDGGLRLSPSGFGISTGRWNMSGTRVNPDSNVDLYNGVSALATTATAGFLGIPSCAGPPTGVPASIPTGQIPLCYDSTNDQLYIYRAGWKKIPAVAYS